MPSYVFIYIYNMLDSDLLVFAVILATILHKTCHVTFCKRPVFAAQVGIAILEELLSNPTPEASKGKSREAEKQ